MFIKTLPLGALLPTPMPSLITCHKEPGEKPKPSTESIQATLSATPDRLSLRVGKHVQLGVPAAPTDAALQYTYKSANETVTTVGNQGLVAVVAEGYCTITMAAGEARVTVPVQVSPAVQIDAKRYIGVDDTDKRSVPIYVPILTETEQHRDEIQKVNEAKDWLLEGDRRVPGSPSYILSLIAPNQGDNCTGICCIKYTAYRYIPGRTDRSSLLLFTACLSNEDTLIKTYQKGKDSKAYNLLKSIAQGYGLTEDFRMTRNDKKRPLFNAYCKGRYPEDDLWPCIRSVLTPDGAGFGLRLRVATSTASERQTVDRDTLIYSSRGR